MRAVSIFAGTRHLLQLTRAAASRGLVAAGLAIWHVGSGEWLLRKDNGGLKIATRTALVSAELYGAALVLSAATRPGAIWLTFDLKQMCTLVHETIPWLGAILGSTYLALYSRFASQWSYLSGLYNSIMSAEALQDANQKPLTEWKREFCTECELLHLSKREPFQSRIRHWQRTALSRPPSSTSLRQVS